MLLIKKWVIGCLENKNDFSLLTDYERTRILLWDSYTGFSDNYNRYMLYSFFKKNSSTHLSGVYRYAIAFFELARNFIIQQEDKLKDILKEKGFKKVDDLYKYYFDDYSLLANFGIAEFQYLKKVATSFMFQSGLMNISYQKNPLSAFARSQT